MFLAFVHLANYNLFVIIETKQTNMSFQWDRDMKTLVLVQRTRFECVIFIFGKYIIIIFALVEVIILNQTSSNSAHKFLFVIGWLSSFAKIVHEY